MLLQLRRIKKPEIKAKEQKKKKKKKYRTRKHLLLVYFFFLMQGNRTLDPFLTFLSSNYSGNAVLYRISIIFSGISKALSLLGVSLDKGPTALTYWNIGASSGIIVMI